MRGAARVGIDKAGDVILGGGQDFVRVDGALWAVLGDPVQGHGAPPHAGPVMAQGSAFVRINGIPVCLLDHKASCGHPSTGASWAGASI